MMQRMFRSRRSAILLAASGSAALLLAAWGFQFFGYAPCKMCVWQRWPHGVAVVVGILALLFGRAIFVILGGLAALVTSAIGVFHAGVERGLWSGPDTCTSGDVSQLSPDELMDQIMHAPLVRCDEIPWEFLHLSMAGWNALLSACLAVLWFVALSLPRDRGRPF